MPEPMRDDEQWDQWALRADEEALLPGMMDKGRLGFAVQLKFRQIFDRYPEQHGEVEPAPVQRIADQIRVPVSTWPDYALVSRLSQRHRNVIREFLGFQRSGSDDLARFVQWFETH